MLTDQDIKKLTEAQEQVFATKKDFVEFGDRIATKSDLAGLETRMATKEDLTDLEERVVSKFSDLQTSVDRYLKFTEAWHQELTILRSRQDRLTQVLIGKGLVSEKEIALIV